MRPLRIRRLPATAQPDLDQRNMYCAPRSRSQNLLAGNAATVSMWLVRLGAEQPSTAFAAAGIDVRVCPFSGPCHYAQAHTALA